MGNPQREQAPGTSPAATRVSPPFAWRDEFAIGIADIDAQHRMLLDILNHINSVAAQGRRAKDALLEIFEDLNEYAAYHFLSEEKLMQAHLAAEPETARHVVSHRSYWVKVHGFKERFGRGETGVCEDVLAFLNTWWIDHILGMDRRMGADLTRRGVR